MTGLEGALESIFELVVFVVILFCCLGLLPFLKLQILRKIVPAEEIKFEYVSIFANEEIEHFFTHS